jgi:hypothetical protein
MAAFPRKIKEVAKNLADPKAPACFKLRKNPFHAELQKLSPVTAWYAKAA